jgi:tripartite-type tricarboxylate transporter receptor subunit TctC
MKWTIVLAVAACAVLAAPGGAQDRYPSRPVKLVLPQPAGGAVDLIARALADRLAEQMGRPFIVENMPGANGSLAGGNVARSPSDGYTLMLAVDSNLVINPSLYHTLTYDPFKDFAPISIIARLNMVLVANPKISANSVKELIAYAKVYPQQAQLRRNRHRQCHAYGHGAIQIYDQDRDQPRVLSRNCSGDFRRGRR